jgi:hypothetical protein
MMIDFDGPAGETLIDRDQPQAFARLTKRPARAPVARPSAV